MIKKRGRPKGVKDFNMRNYELQDINWYGKKIKVWVMKE